MSAPAAPAKALSGPQQALRKLGLTRPIDLALHLPLRYEDETRLVTLREGRDGAVIQFEGEVTASEVRITGRRQWLLTAHDGRDPCVLRFFNFYPAQQKAWPVGGRVRVRGELRGGGLAGYTMMHPQLKAPGGPLPDALTPVYPASAGLPQAYVRKAVLASLDKVDLSEALPPEAQAFFGANGGQPLWSIRQALGFLHRPAPEVSLATLEDRSHPAWLRLKVEELVAQQLSQQRARRERERQRAPVLAARADGLAAQLLAALPFALTAAQRRVGEEIARNLASPTPMHRLLQGDVGSGKTVVAALAACIAIDNGWQGALMAPTEILAQQHFAKLVEWLEPLLAPRGQSIAWLIGSQRKKARAEMLARIESGEAALVVGTHAVIQEQVRFARLGLAVIDEQHRFGVAQRLALRAHLSTAGAEAGAAVEPHLLMMSATPIPRTLAMSYYADLDVSTLDELPPGRTPVVTRLLAAHRRAEVIERIKAQLREGRQVYWVCPLVEESEALDLSNATATHGELSGALHGVRGADGHPVMVGLLHARMPAAEKKAVMDLFSHGTMGVLVSTTVIEVGVDVPNASLMVIEHAERFGLSQLHQLRGRVGRGQAASACVLLYAQPEGARLSQASRERLKAMVDTHDGFEIARRDLDIRGPGEFMGERQSGAPLLRFADLNADAHLIEPARAAAAWMLDHAPELAERHEARWLGGKAEFLRA